MRKFKRNPAVRLVVLPTHGRVYDYDILEGEEYAQYCPSLLVEIEPEAAVPEPLPEVVVEPVVAVPVTATEQVAEVVPPVGEVNSPDTALPASMDSAEAPAEKRKRGRPKKA